MKPWEVRKQLGRWRRKRENLERGLAACMTELDELVVAAERIGMPSTEIAKRAGINRATLYKRRSR